MGVAWVLLAAILPFVLQPASAQIAAGVQLVSVKFVGVTQLAPAEVERCSTELKSRTYEGPEWLRAVAGRAQNLCWQSQGYFKATIKPQAEQLPDRDGTHQFAVTLTVDEGLQYRLRQIKFRGGKVFGADELRKMIPIVDGDIFNSEAIGKGIENLRRAYGELGYINFISVPDTNIDDDNRLIALNWDLDEGKQFRVSTIEFAGAPKGLETQLRANAPMKPGDVYSSKALDQYVAQLASILRRRLQPAQDAIIKTDNQHATVSITFQLAGENSSCGQR